MKKYKLYGIGNALLDYEYLVDEKMLEKLEVDKGTMLLNDFEKHTLIHKRLKNTLSVKKISPGGSVANSVYAMAKFGDDVCFTGKISNDITGDTFASSLSESGVNCYLKKIKEDVSGECLVLITPDNERTMNTYLGSSSMLNKKDISQEFIKYSKFLLIEGYLVSATNTYDVCLEAIKQCKDNNTKIVVTLSDPNIVNFFRDNILGLVENSVEFIFCNEQEALNFSQKEKISDAIKYLRKFTKRLIITLGSKGVTYVDDRISVSIDGRSVKSRDFTGAGDMFLGAFLHKFNSDDDISTSLEFANICASEIIQVYGAKFEDDQDYVNLSESNTR